MSNWIKVLPLAPLLALATAAQVPQSVPNGLPSWAYNIPDKVQAPRAEATGPVHLPGTTKVYDAAEVASSANPPDWFPNEHGAAPRIVKDETGMTRWHAAPAILCRDKGILNPPISLASPPSTSSVR